jgi:hypothetical protein
MAGRLVYKLGEHRLRVLVIDVQAGTRRRQYISAPILTRCLEKTGELLKLEKATENDLRIVRQIKTRPRTQEQETPGEGQEGQQPGQPPEGEIREVIYSRIGSWRADLIRLVYKEKIEEEPEGDGQGNNQEGENQDGTGEDEEEKYKIRTLHIPVPSWAPNYKVVPVLFAKARAAELKVVGAYRKGYLIPAPNQGS